MKKAEYLTPVITAFDKNGNIDENANKAVYDYLIDRGLMELLSWEVQENFLP